MAWKLCENKSLENELQNINEDDDDDIDLEDHERFGRSADPEPRRYRYRYRYRYRTRFSRYRYRRYSRSDNSSSFFGELKGWHIALIVAGAVLGLMLVWAGIKHCCMRLCYHQKEAPAQVL